MLLPLALFAGKTFSTLGFTFSITNFRRPAFRSQFLPIATQDLEFLQIALSIHPILNGVETGSISAIPQPDLLKKEAE